MPPLVSTTWLAQNAQTPNLIILDASVYLPTEAKNPHTLFTQAHIPGARFFDLDQIADPETTLPHMAPTAGRFERQLTAIGINNTNHLVFYDQKGLFSAARGWWLMRLFGHQNAAVLDGGLPKWRAEGHPIATGTPEPPATTTPATFRAALHTARLRGLADMQHNLATQTELVLDARPAGRFTGATPEPRPNLPSGHIPNAVSLPATELLAPDQTLLPPDRLRARLTQAGATATRPITTTCGTGVTAAIITLALAVAGLPEGALYDGSWTEWASRPETPKATAPESP